MISYRRGAFITAVVSALVGILIAWQSQAAPEQLPDFVHGTDGTALFLTFSEPGQINVQLATAQAMLQNHPDVQIHFASFPSAAGKVARISRSIAFHELPGPDRIATMFGRMNCTTRSFEECLAHRPGWRGAALLAEQMELAMWTWTGEEHFAIYQRISEILEEVDPAVSVVDFAFRPAIDALKKTHRFYMIMSPLAVADLFAVAQPCLSGLWKYPAWGTGFSFPVPWYKVPENIYLQLRTILPLFIRRHSRETMEYLLERDIDSSIDLPADTLIPFITQTIPGASIPLDVIPPNVTSVGAMLLDSSSAATQDADLVEWIAKAPTVLINLGSLFTYNEQRARLMAEAVSIVLSRTEVQVLWKMAKQSDYGDGFTSPLEEYVSEGRLRLTDWVSVDTLTLLQTGSISTFIHHGGSSSFNEAIVAGVPQVVIPMWEDLYNFAQLAEDLGVGVYATRKTAPAWTVDGLTDGFLAALTDSDRSRGMMSEARRLGEIARETQGRDIAAQEVARWAYGGRGSIESA
ncbi:UDP-Glycosyltransferase/glycogen phosphorylase [Xylariaceae sp. FL0016]|nr:UDP-Glycosyltransferase/glycogen phosphorylase [Xylariaceae sp. FL0016]